MKNTNFKTSQYACAVLLIVSSIALVTYQVVSIDNVASGLLYYVAQSFLLAGSIFGLDQYIRLIAKKLQESNERRNLRGCMWGSIIVNSGFRNAEVNLNYYVVLIFFLMKFCNFKIKSYFCPNN